MRPERPAWLPSSRELRDYFARVAAYSHYRVQLTEYLARLLPDGPLRLIDVGAGDGLLGGVLQQWRPETEVVGAETFIRDRAWRSQQIPMVQFDGLHLPFDDATFDCALLSNVLHHVGHAESQARLLREVARVTKSRIVVKDHLAESLLDRSKLALLDIVGNRRFGASTTGTYLNEKEWTAVFAGIDAATIVSHRDLRFREGAMGWLFSNGLEIMFAIDLIGDRGRMSGQ